MLITPAANIAANYVKSDLKNRFGDQVRKSLIELAAAAPEAIQVPQHCLHDVAVYPLASQAQTARRNRQKQDYTSIMIMASYSEPANSNRYLPVGARTAIVAVALAGLAACGGKERPAADLAAAQITTIGVNSYLWRAALETVSFAPLLQADSAGGVIVTDWYANPENPGERVKMTVTILDQDLRADALRVAASRQIAQSGNWVDAPVQAATVQKLEDIILTKARTLRRQSVSS